MHKFKCYIYCIYIVEVSCMLNHPRKSDGLIPSLPARGETHYSLVGDAAGLFLFWTDVNDTQVFTVRSLSHTG